MKNLLVITSHSFNSQQGAGYARLGCYSKALFSSHNFYLVELDVFYKHRVLGEFECLSGYRIFSINEKSCDTFLYKNFLKLINLSRSIKQVTFIRKHFLKTNTSVLIYSSHFFQTIISLIFLKFLFGFKVYFEKNELEIGKILNVSIQRNVVGALQLFLWPLRFALAFMLDFLPFLSDGIIVISRNLNQLYRFHKNVIKIPILVDSENLKNNVSAPKEDIVKFVYLGAITKNKDALFIVLDALFSIRSIIRGQAEFWFIGDGNNYILSSLRKKIAELKIHDIVFLRGAVPYAEIPLIVKNFDVGYLIRKKNIQTRFGFSTKLGDYLAGGLVVLTNDISDNKLYLTEEIDAYFVDSVDQNEIGKAVLRILNNKNNIYQMKLACIETAKRFFDYRVYESNLVGFLS